MMVMDTTTPFGARAETRLKNDQIIWLTTVRHDGMPQPTPVWFLWENGTMLIFSEPNQQKIRNIQRDDKVALHFDSDGRGGNIVVFEGQAEILDSAPSQETFAAYFDKYREGIKGLGMAPDEMVKKYSTAIRIRPAKLRGF